MIPPPVGLLETERLLLRPVEAEDNIFMFAIRSDAEVNKYVPITPPEHVFEIDAFIKKIQNNQAERKSDFWIIVLKETGRAIGTITLWQYDWEKREAEIGFTLMKEYWQKGIMKEAAKIVFAVARNPLQMITVHGWTHKDNIGSQKILEGHKMQRNPELEATIDPNGVEKDLWVYSVRLY